MSITNKVAYQPRESKIPFFEIQPIQNEQIQLPVRDQYYHCILIKSGAGKNNSDLVTYPFFPIQMFFYTPYQLFEFKGENNIEGIHIRFHSDFFCLEKHGREVNCNGVLFNNAFGSPFIVIERPELAVLEENLQVMAKEINSNDIALGEILLSYFKIFLLTCVRIKIKQTAALPDNNINANNTLLNQFEQLIEANYKTLHNPGKYAEMLKVSLKSLNNQTKKQYNKSSLEIIQHRIIIEAQRLLYLTDKPIKEIAFELGFHEVQYFNRLFKKKASITPGAYRKELGLFR